MKKTTYIMILLVLLISITGCKKEEEKDYELEKKEFFECIVKELDTYMVSEKQELKEIPTTELFDSQPEEMSYYKGKYGSDENRYVIYSEIPWNRDTALVFDKYFASKYDEYYEYTTKGNNFYIYLHHSNLGSINLKEIENKCRPKEEIELITEKVPSNIQNNLKKTDRIVIKRGDEKIGVIKSKDSIKKVLDAVADSDAPVGGAFTCPGHAFDFEMYAGEEKIDTLNVWAEGRGLLPESFSSSGCFRFSINDDELNLNNVIEDETDYIFYGINIISEKDDLNGDIKRLVAEDDEYKYYYEHFKTKKDKVYITFSLTNKTMSLDYALKNNYIKPKQLDYSGLFTKEKKDK